MDVVNFDALKAQGRILDLANVDPEEDYLIIGKYTNKYTTDNFKYTKYPIYAIKAGDVIGVQSVTGLDTDNTDPLNPVVNIAVDGTTITGQGTVADPLVAVIPQPAYKVYAALLTQTGIDAPVATILENTLGNIVWSRTGDGNYEGLLTGAFTLNKTAVILGNKGYSLSNALLSPADVLYSNYGDIDKVYIGTINTVVSSDNILDNTFIEIRVYN